MGDLIMKEDAYYNCHDIVFVYFAESIHPRRLDDSYIYVDGSVIFDGVAPANRSGGLKDLALGLWVLARCENKCTWRAKKLFYEFSNF